ncbi:DDHD domain-containing protein [Choanephora cucurbitarum]|nr:DDHD domain-containing protein [Choanephora cucurbitarum]
MFFEATYVPSPPQSITSLDDQEVEQPSPTVEEVEPSSDKPVDHLIFVIHGIGQQTEQYGHFYEHIENLQETTRQVLQAKVPDHNVRIELIPIEWHRHIHEQVDPIINKITLKSIPTIRLIENDYLADVLYYFSKDRGQKIVDNVTQLFNTSYQNFMEKHPNFEGKIAIIGYSLGGIITWDVLSHQRTPENEAEEAQYQKIDVKFSKLDFKPDYFFGLGSPVGAVLTFRGQDPKLYHPDFDIVFENIFHPFDPLAYRFEPLFSDYFIDRPAILVDRSIPIGPSFSFPSIPSSFLSFFSWKQEDKVAKSLYNTTEDAVGAGVSADLDTKQKVSQPSSGILNYLYQYFSKGGGGSNLDQQKEDPSGEDADERKRRNPLLARSSTDKLSVNGIITWDPLREQTREQLLALRDDLDRTLNAPVSSLDRKKKKKKRPSVGHRSKTLQVDSPSAIETKDSSVCSTPSTSTSTTTDNSDTATHTSQDLKPKLRKSLTDRRPQHHLVEVLGIDGLRMDSFDHRTNGQEDKDTKNTDKHEINDGGHDIWSDLNKEIHKPGPAITSPGESRAEVAKDATMPNDDDDDEDQKKTKEEEEREIQKLPGKHRTDYVLQPESVMSMIANEYLIGLRAHFSYWTNKDFIWHMLRRIEKLEEKAIKKESIPSSDSEKTEQTKPIKPIVSVDPSHFPQRKQKDK